MPAVVVFFFMWIFIVFVNAVILYLPVVKGGGSKKPSSDWKIGGSIPRSSSHGQDTEPQMCIRNQLPSVEHLAWQPMPSLYEYVNAYN